MFGIGRSKTNSSFGVLIDVGSGSVGIGIVESNPNEKLPRLLFARRLFMRVTKRNGTESEQVRQMRETLLSANLVLSIDGMSALREREPHGELSSILIMCSAPWARTITRNVSFKSEEPFKITKELIHDLVVGVEEEAATENANQNTIHAEGFSIVERATVDVRINDYSINNPIDLKGTEISLSHITGLVPKEILESIHEVHDKLYPKSTITAHTAMLVLYCVIRNLFPQTNSFVIIDVTGEATEFGIVENGLLINTMHMPLGSNTLIRRIAESGGKTPGDVESLLHGYTNGLLTDETKNELEKETLAYKTPLIETVQKLLEMGKLPKTLVIVTQSNVYPLFRDIIPRVITDTTHDVYSVLPTDSLILSDIVYNETPDTYLALAARFFHTKSTAAVNLLNKNDIYY